MMTTKEQFQYRGTEKILAQMSSGQSQCLAKAFIQEIWIIQTPPSLFPNNMFFLTNRQTLFTAPTHVYLKNIKSPPPCLLILCPALLNPAQLCCKIDGPANQQRLLVYRPLHMY